MTKKKSNKNKGKRDNKVKKEEKQEPKADKETEIEKFKSNAALWEAKYKMTEMLRLECREEARALARAHEELTSQQYRAEKDMAEIIQHLNNKHCEKQALMAALGEQIETEKIKALEEKDLLKVQFMQKMEAVDEKYKHRKDDFQSMPGDLQTIQEFHKAKTSLEEDLIRVTEEIRVADRRFKDELRSKEYEFYTAMVLLEKEAEQKISRLAEQANYEATEQLTREMQTVFKDNLRLNESLKCHLQEAEEMRRINTAMTEKNAFLKLLKETNELVKTEADFQLRMGQNEISELRARLFTLHETLGIAAGEWALEKKEEERNHAASVEAHGRDIERIQFLLEVRKNELMEVKRVAESIIEQRKDLEFFFHTALDYVRKTIKSRKLHNKQEALKSYRYKIKEALAGRQEYPRIQTFSDAPNSTNNYIDPDLDDADKWSNLNKRGVDISDLTWEQKERLLMLIFAQMNGQKIRKPMRHLAPSKPFFEKTLGISDTGFRERKHGVTFITQTPGMSDTRLPALKGT